MEDVLKDFDAQYRADLGVDWVGRGRISPGVYGRVEYASHRALDRSLQGVLAKRCRRMFPKSRALTSHSVTIRGDRCTIAFDATPGPPVKKRSLKEIMSAKVAADAMLSLASQPSRGSTPFLKAVELMFEGATERRGSLCTLCGRPSPPGSSP
jgi:hypothetical protein